jgi:hypothetical protein
MPTPRPKVHAILAREGHSAIVIVRQVTPRGTCTVKWNRDDDTFELGQWIRGRIYERRCDLSPNGTWFIYFAVDRRRKEEGVGSWTAISRAPYLKALGFWPGESEWNGGGLFPTNVSYWRCISPFERPSGTSRTPAGLEEAPNSPFEGRKGECPLVYYSRLEQEGWKMVPTEGGFWSEAVLKRLESARAKAVASGLSEAEADQLAWDECKVFIRQYERTAERHTFEKHLSHGWMLRQIAEIFYMGEGSNITPGRAMYYYKYQLRNLGSGRTLTPSWEWGDLDGERLVWVENGILYAGVLTEAGVSDEVPLRDFNDMHFEAIPAPY